MTTTLDGRTPVGVEMRRQARAVARVEAMRVLDALLVDDDGRALRTLDQAAAGLAGALAVFVGAMRDEGASWADVAAGTGRTRQAAQQRFGSGRPAVVDTADELVEHFLTREGYEGRVPGYKVRAGHVGHLAGYCFRRQHGRCPGHSKGEPCSCWCHEPGVLFPVPAAPAGSGDWS